MFVAAGSVCPSPIPKRLGRWSTALDLSTAGRRNHMPECGCGYGTYRPAHSSVCEHLDIILSLSLLQSIVDYLENWEAGKIRS